LMSSIIVFLLIECVDSGDSLLFLFLFGRENKGEKEAKRERKAKV